MESNYQKVKLWNETFEAVTNSEPQPGLLKENPELIKHRLALVTEEYNELCEGVITDDMEEICDALGDIIFVCLGFFSTLGVDGQKVFDIITESNFTKLCSTEEEAKLSVEKYLLEGRYSDPAYKITKNGMYWIVYDRATGKILKNINYKAVNLKPILCSLKK